MWENVSSDGRFPFNEQILENDRSINLICIKILDKWIL